MERKTCDWGRRGGNPAHWTGKLPTQANGKTVIFSCPPLLTETEWKDIETRRHKQKERVGRRPNKSDEFLLDGLLRCGFCVDISDNTGRSGRMNSWKDPKTGKKFYRCYWSSCTSKTLLVNHRKHCPLPLVQARWVEKAVVQSLYTFLFWEPEERLVPAFEDTSADEKRKSKRRLPGKPPNFDPSKTC